MVFLAKDMLLTTKVVIVITIIVFDLFCYVFLVDYDSVVQFNLSFIFYCVVQDSPKDFRGSSMHLPIYSQLAHVFSQVLPLRGRY